MNIPSILFLLLLFAPQLARTSTIVTGQVQSGSTPIEFASVLATGLPDSSERHYTVTDGQGVFRLEGLHAGKWRIRCSFIGYNTLDTLVVLAPGLKQTSLGIIQLTPSTAINLKDVTITATQPKALEYAIDKKIYIVDKDLQSTSGSASDVLQNIPSVQVDLDGNVSLRGSGQVMFLVNGKPSPQLGKNAAEALQNIPASSIERIEVITNPSAKYRPDGMGGIINIVLKRNIQQGWNGSATLNAGNHDRYNGNITAGGRTGKWNLSGTFGMRQNTQRRFGKDDRSYLDSAGQMNSYYLAMDTARGRSFSENAVIGIEWGPDSNNTFSLSGNYSHFTVERRNGSVRHYRDKNFLETGTFERYTLRKVDETEVESALAWEHRFGNPDHTLSIELNKVWQDENEDQLSHSEFQLPVSNSTADNIYLKKKDDPAELALDYAFPVSEDAALEAGYLGTFSNIRMFQDLENMDSSGQFYTPDTLHSYVFNYNDQVHAVYTTWEQSIEDFGVLVGLRAEQAQRKGEVPTIDSAFSNSYLGLYPTIHVGYELENGELGLSYSRRVNRPDGDELNPFPEYEDPLHWQVGNPDLLPENVHSLELGGEIRIKRISLMPTLYYRYTYNGFTTVTHTLNDSIVITSQENLSNEQAGGLELIASGYALPWLSGHLSGNVYYRQIDASDLGYSNKKSNFTFSANLNSTLRLSKGLAFQLGCIYRAEELTPQGRMLPSFVLNIGSRYEFMKSRWAVILTLSDVLQSQRYRMELDGTEVIQVTERKRDSRIFFAGIRYRFGGVTKKQKEEGVQFDNSER